MPVKLIAKRSARSRPVFLIGAGACDELDEAGRRWASENGFDGQAGRLLLLPGANGEVAGAALGTGAESDARAAMLAGVLGRDLPAGDWHFVQKPQNPELQALAIMLGAYRFTKYGGKAGADISFALPSGANIAETAIIAEGVCLARDLINTPASDMGPEALEKSARQLAARHKARVKVIQGDDLLKQNFPMIHAVGRAAADAPRLIDFGWGPKQAPKVTLVGKGVCFDTGGLDIKPASGMLLMKKDMGGAANVLGLASMIMALNLKIRLRVLIPAVENAISGSAFRPGDVLTSRKGLTVEIGNTDAEGRLVLADALTLADEEEPDLLIDMATLTGAARVALGPDVPPFYTRDDRLANMLAATSESIDDPLWRLPLWQPYAKGLSSRIADINNVTSDGFAGSITAALFLSRFVEKAASWAHFDIYAWNPKAKPQAPVGGEAQAIRALLDYIRGRYAA